MSKPIIDCTILHEGLRKNIASSCFYSFMSIKIIPKAQLSSIIVILLCRYIFCHVLCCAQRFVTLVFKRFINVCLYLLLKEFKKKETKLSQINTG